MLNFSRIEQDVMEVHPFAWKFIDQLFSPADAAALAASFPRDHFKKVTGHDGEKSYAYWSRSLIHMGASTATYAEALSPAWAALAKDLLSPDYRKSLSRLTGRDLASCDLEVNAIHYGPGAWLGPHLDLKEKIATHVLYFNESWNPADGGCIRILNSSNPEDVAAEIPPIVGGSSLLVRSESSWHMVSKVKGDCRLSRRSLNVIFHQAGSASTMWPPGDLAPLADFDEAASLGPA